MVDVYPNRLDMRQNMADISKLAATLLGQC